MRDLLRYITNKRRWYGYVFVVIVVYMGMAWQHLYLGRIFEEKLVFGNDGDGFFNLWILDHNREYLLSGLQSWMNGRIFYPDHRFSLLWSDILLIPTLPFTIFTLAGLDRFAAYRLTVIVFSFLGFLAAFASLLCIRKWSWKTTRDSLPVNDFLLILLFTVTLVFSVNQLQGYEHFQNIGWIGVLLIVMGMCAFVLAQRGLFIGLVLLIEAGLLMTAPYYAVIAFILLCFCGVVFLMRDGKKACFITLYRGRYWLLLSFLMIIPIFLYGKVPHIEYSPQSIHAELASRPSEFVVPSAGSLRSFLETLPVSLPVSNHESPAYVGLGFLLLIAALPFLYMLHGRTTEKSRWMMTKQLSVLAGIYAVYRLTRESGWLGYGMAWSVLGCFVYLFISHYRQKGLDNNTVFISAVLSASTLICIGFAIGPNPSFFEFPINPSLYGIFETVVPGVSNMRAIGRMSALAHIFLGLWLFYHYGRLLYDKTSGHRQTATLLMVFVFLGIQITEVWPVKAQVNYYSVSHFTPGDEEVKLLERAAGSMAVFPTTPWHKNTYYMLYFNQFDSINLVNGYSARSTDFFDRLMEAEKGEIPTREQLALLKERGCDFFTVHVRKISDERFAELNKHYRLLGKTKKFAVFSIL